MNVIPDFKKLAAIKEHFEGFENIAYPDTGGVWTVGFGSTWNFDKQRKVKKSDIISRDTATRWMSLEVEGVINQANRYINKPLNPDQSACIVDYIYNRGIGNFLSTKLDELINANPDDPKIKEEIIGTGLKDRAGNLLWGLGRRRRAQAYLYFTGQLKFDWPRWGALF
jgi:lysozyme